MDNRAIGVFDSGLGGLTVLKEMMRLLPNESLVYFGDCGRIPYGSKSKETVIKYTFQDIRFLLTHDVKMIVIACNTASACSLELVKGSFNIPVVGVIEPGAEAAANVTSNRKVGIIGTSTTISSKVYERALNKFNGGVQIFSMACPLFVPLVEEGWCDNDITCRIAREYLLPLKEKEIDTLVLGCTHYPLLENAILQVIGDEVRLVNSGKEAACAAKRLLEKEELLQDEGLMPVYRFYTSDSVEKFSLLGSVFLGREITCIDRIDIEKY